LSHLALMTLYAALVGFFFALLWRRGRKEQTKLFLQIFLGMMLGAILVGWLMYAFPTGPPAPIP
jgi:hypothetical protein